MNPFVKLHNRQRGYIRCTVTPETWTNNYMVVDQVFKPVGKTTVRASFILESTNSKVKPA